MIDIIVDILKEYGIYLLTSTGIFLSILLNRPKTAKKLQEIEAKKEAKLAKKGTKYFDKAMSIYNQIVDGVDKNG